MVNSLEIRDVSKSFGALRVNHNISFDLRKGEALGVIGPNGAGKSTLFNLIAGVLSVDNGTITLNGEDVTRQSPMLRCRNGIGRSFQIPQPFGELSVFENLLVATQFGSALPAHQTAEQCALILEQLGLLDDANKPSGSLPLLQRKRLELARALATDPQVLLLDEIAGGLTDAECDLLIETIRGIHGRGISIIWIEHVLRALTSVVERILVLNFGEMIAFGQPDEVMASNIVKEIYLGIQV